MNAVDRAIERQKNLEEAAKSDKPKSELDIEAGGRFEFGDRYIDIIPDKTRETVSIYCYRNGRNTAAVCLSLRAALVLATRLPEILDKEYREQIVALTEKIKQEEVLNIQEEFEKIDTHFDKISPEILLSDLVQCGLGIIRDCTESGWVMVGAKNTKPEEIQK